MAKWGEGDPRWIVEERPDATNVNNWHWTEKNATPWSKERLQQLFQDFIIEQNDISCIVETIDKCTGEATVNNRKGKLIFFYEWELVLKWSGCLLKNSNIAHKGKITIPNLSEENDLDEVEITVTVDESNDESETLKQFMYVKGRDRIRQQLGIYIKELKEEYSKNLILPKKGEEGSGNSNFVSQIKNKVESVKSVVNTHTMKDSLNSAQQLDVNEVGCKLDARTLKMTIDFHCSANDIYNALTLPEMLTAFTRAPATVEPVRGGEFILYGGNVQGKFEELVPEKRIQQSWRLKHWTAGHYSRVLFELEENQSGTQLILKQTGIPASEYDAMGTNWVRYYWNSIKQTFGFGASLADVI